MSWTAGYYGKIPSRGDFVGHGLAAATRDAMDAWCQRVIPGSQARLGSDWAPAWMEAPIWRFRLAADRFGPDPVAGVWLPSTDRAGRLYPLIIAIAGPDLAMAGAFLDCAETIGLDAIEHDLPPGQVAEATASAAARSAPLRALEGEWWTKGSPRVAPTRRMVPALPDDAAFAAMLTDARDPSAASSRP